VQQLIRTREDGRLASSIPLPVIQIRREGRLIHAVKLLWAIDEGVSGLCVCVTIQQP